jgi:RecA/RadA recombinase
MATKKKGADALAVNPWAFFDTVTTTDPFVDAGVDRPTYGFADSGSYALNAVICGDCYGGFPKNKVIQAAGLYGSGKSLIGKYNFCPPLFADQYFIYYIDTENETTKEDLKFYADFPEKQFKVLHFHTVEQCHHGISTILKQLEDYMKENKTLINPHKLAFVLDSQGMLSTNKAVNDVIAGEDKTDLTKAKKLAAMYRDITFRMGELGCPMYVTNHMYIDPNAAATHSDPKKVAGGEGAKYSASVILSVYKLLERVNVGSSKDDKKKEVQGIFIQVGNIKNRMVHEGFGTRLYLSYKNGLSRYYGLHVWAQEAGLIQKYTNQKDWPGLELPKINGKTFLGNKWVICDPNKPRDQWLVAPEPRLHTAQYIGTILDPINEYVKARYKNQKLGVFGDENTEAATEDELSKVDESLLDTADAEVNSKLIKKAAQQAEALGLDAEKDLDAES